MCQIATKPSELAACMIERVSAVLMMETAQLDLDWLTVFPIPQITACCARMTEPFVAGRRLFSAARFSEISKLFSICTGLADIARMLHQNGVVEELTLRDYRYFAEDAAEYHRLLDVVVQRLGPKASAELIHHWQKNNCSLSELRRMERRTGMTGDLDRSGELSTYGGYVNLLYGKRFKAIDLSRLTDYQEDVLTYAIVHNKKHFIRLVDENSELFFDLSRKSILFQEEFYRERFNLNELTAKDLADCAGMSSRKLSGCLFTGSRPYTFPEWKLLYGASTAYVVLYGKLQSESRDYRIRVLRQLLKRDALNEINDTDNLTALAALLDRKPLHDWRQEEFGHVEGLTVGDTAKLLVHSEKLAHLLPGIQTRTDAMLVLRNVDRLAQFDSIDALKAELMGQFTTLKYFEGDLERELGCPVSQQIKTEWPKNDSATGGGMEVREQDDFFSTLLLGTQPYRTCLSYEGGAYCGCLLACFDSNKKVMYARKGGHVIGRACIRLTKCRLGWDTHENGDSAGKFSFVDLEDVAGSREQQPDSEWVTLFLERPYISRANPDDEHRIKRMFAELARQKAKELGAMLVLSMEYSSTALPGFAQTQLSIYISASKAGEQYLDSLGGQATTSKQGSYESSHFLVDRETAETILKEV